MFAQRPVKGRSSFYPLPPSEYPKPVIDDCPKFETTYAHQHGDHHSHDAYRARTLSSEARLATGHVPEPNREQGLYPRHGTGFCTTPYYRRDSKGFRRSYEQPSHVDANYINYQTYKKSQSELAATQQYWSHPASQPSYLWRDTAQAGPTPQQQFAQTGIDRNTSLSVVSRAHDAAVAARSASLAQRPVVFQQQDYASTANATTLRQPHATHAYHNQQQ